MITRIQTYIHSLDVDAHGHATRARIGRMRSSMPETETSEFPIVLQALTAPGLRPVTEEGFDYTFDFDME